MVSIRDAGSAFFRVSISLKKRIDWIDIAKAYGIILLFYGHVLDVYYQERLGLGVVGVQFQFIYAFHMPLFFILSGYVAKLGPIRIKEYILSKLRSRLGATVVFNVLIIPFYLFGPLSSNPVEFVKQFLCGNPLWNPITWFLVCLLAAEFIHLLVHPLLKSKTRIALAFTIFFTAGSLITLNLKEVVEATGIPTNFWYLHEGLIAYSFYLIGIMLRQTDVLARIDQKRLFMISLILLLILLSFFGLNVVVGMRESVHGVPLLFLLNAVAGSAVIIIWSFMTRPGSLLLFIGRNSLFFMCLNGFCLLLVNKELLYILAQAMNYIQAIRGEESLIVVFMAVTIITLAGCGVIIYLVNRVFEYGSTRGIFKLEQRPSLGADGS